MAKFLASQPGNSGIPNKILKGVCFVIETDFIDFKKQLVLPPNLLHNNQAPTENVASSFWNLLSTF